MTIRTVLIAAIAMTSMAGAAFAADPWFTENDGMPGMSLLEFNSGYDKSGDFDRMDSDKDGMVSRDEHRAGVWMRSDRNKDGSLDDDEMGMLNDAIVMGNPDGQ